MATQEVLIIDDDPDLRALVSKILENSGFEVREAENVSQAFELVDRHAPHLVITDLNMPGETGFNFLEKRRSFSALRGVPVIVLSGVRQKKAIYEAMSLGVDDFITKPFTASILTQKIRKLLKDRKFLSISFPTDRRLQINGGVMSSITRISEVAYILEGPVKIAPETRISLKSELLEKLEISDCLFRTANRPALLSTDGIYRNQVTIIGMKEQTAQKVRKTVVHWR